MIERGRIGTKLLCNYGKQLNFTMFCASNACGASSAHLNYTKHPMIRSVYRFHVHYHVTQVRYGKGPVLKIEQNFETLQNDSRLLY